MADLTASRSRYLALVLSLALPAITRREIAQLNVRARINNYRRAREMFNYRGIIGSTGDRNED